MKRCGCDKQLGSLEILRELCGKQVGLRETSCSKEGVLIGHNRIFAKP
jgi:hypothetical protein